jgi:hypothetical protein
LLSTQHGPSGQHDPSGQHEAVSCSGTPTGVVNAPLHAAPESSATAAMAIPAKTFVRMVRTPLRYFVWLSINYARLAGRRQRLLTRDGPRPR